MKCSHLETAESNHSELAPTTSANDPISRRLNDERTWSEFGTAVRNLLGAIEDLPPSALVAHWPSALVAKVAEYSRALGQPDPPLRLSSNDTLFVRGPFTGGLVPISHRDVSEDVIVEYDEFEEMVLPVTLETHQTVVAILRQWIREAETFSGPTSANPPKVKTDPTNITAYAKTSNVELTDKELRALSELPKAKVFAFIQNERARSVLGEQSTYQERFDWIGKNERIEKEQPLGRETWESYIRACRRALGWVRTYWKRRGRRGLSTVGPDGSKAGSRDQVEPEFQSENEE